eukprot:TRINITY_DN12429_c0_g1_i1.p1 TRINITY_DN12429_c0_g1~~TRINITY_DN12429_c0_g1_i1.p1  ORF type:complete len:364 (+),score=68.91 TRINITY_DN12429_c0_g1_i1:71-1162(+)
MAGQSKTMPKRPCWADLADSSIEGASQEPPVLGPTLTADDSYCLSQNKEVEGDEFRQRLVGATNLGQGCGDDRFQGLAQQLGLDNLATSTSSASSSSAALFGGMDFGGGASSCSLASQLNANAPEFSPIPGRPVQISLSSALEGDIMMSGDRGDRGMRTAGGNSGDASLNNGSLQAAARGAQPASVSAPQNGQSQGRRRLNGKQPRPAERPDDKVASTTRGPVSAGPVRSSKRPRSEAAGSDAPSAASAAQGVTPGAASSAAAADSTEASAPLPPATEEEWERRIAKRQRAVKATKDTLEYASWGQGRVSGDIPPVVIPRTPNFEDRTISKRKWEDEVRLWRAALRDRARALGEPTSAAVVDT